ncbi:MAG: ABC transporter ATP-binding protein [Desulfobacterales bacterium]|nr:ABC transporter ATP-binding protein [Desulfobacterales bacterium]
MSILEVRQLKKYFPVTGGIFLRRTGWIHAVDDVSLVVEEGETLGIVGESGCGKTTLGRCIMGLYTPTQGEVVVEGKSVDQLHAQGRRRLARTLQMIFQDPFESLNPRQTIGQALEEKYRILGKGGRGMRGEIHGLLDMVGLPRDALAKFPHEFSGGQRQRIGIARAVSLSPKIIICDEPVSALDVSVQSKILNLLLELQSTLKLTYVFISHDLSVVRHISDRIAVMYLGKIMELAPTSAIYGETRHPYTQALLSAIPEPDPTRSPKPILLSGEVPSVENPPRGCRFHTRCPHAKEICEKEEPVLAPRAHVPDHYSACHFF